ncbi:MAG: GTP 3',8-cyclase MoaA [Ancrocorticia sp.]
MSTTSVPTSCRTNPVVSLGIPIALAPRGPIDTGLPADRPDTPGLIDRFGRVATDLRVSLTDKCNLRCQYCMPAEGIDPLPGQVLLSDGEVNRLVRIGVELLGIREVRFTGGEPLLRKGLEGIVATTATLRTWGGTRPDISLTTNGLGLKHRAQRLRAAGLDRVNLSMDSADRDTYARLTRRDRFDDAVAGAAEAARVGLKPVKLNAVLMPGVNDAGAPDVLMNALVNGYELRFIEYMPLGPRGRWKRGEIITAEDILGLLSRDFVLTPRPGSERGASPAELWDVAPGVYRGVEHRGGSVGIIASVTRPFCGDCDRTRLTADGQIRDCLFASGETDLRAMLRGGSSDEEIANVWRRAMWGKKPGHGINDPSFLSPDRPMSAIGG